MPLQPRRQTLITGAAGGIGQWLQRRPRAGLWLDRVSGVVFVGLGLRMALAR